ncbi:beta-ketoacyl synthase N-terminal-like domain-containing protein [Streptomyces sp. NPDC058045]|uniref:beta-ketoacyl synthase N-terminal-like domain-containing protein n=1 Tax=Streptomyces sp. NPDC058045 TaxID=3346311 RepID=UPI0036EBA9E3
MNISVTGIGLVAPGVREPADLTRTGPTAAETAEDWFDPIPYLGRRGWKYLTPATRYLLAAANEAAGRRHGDEPPAGHDAARSGIATGTHHSISAMHQRLDRSIREEGSAGLSPAELPGFSVNMPASQLAISMECRAFSVTLINPVVAGLDAVLFAVAALRRGRADRVLATATEHAAPGTGVLGGAAALRLDRTDGPAAGEVTGGLSRFVPRTGGGAWSEAALESTARKTAALAAGEPVLRYTFCGPAAAAPIDSAVREACAAAGTVLKDTVFVGADARYGTVSPLLHLAGLVQESGPGLVVAASDDGHLTAVTVRGAV